MNSIQHARPLAAIVIIAGCSTANGLADGAMSTPEASIIDLQFLEEAYGGAEVCVEGDTCGIVGDIDTLSVRPPIVGASLLVSVSLGEASVTLGHDFSEDVRALDLSEHDAVTERVSVGLLRSVDGSCAVYLTNHIIGGTVVSSTPADSLSTPCGPFAEAP